MSLIGDGDDDGVSAMGMAIRLTVASLILIAALAAACIVMVPAGQAIVITRFGNPVRVVTEPGLAWKFPIPIETTVPIDLRLLTTETALQDVGTRDGLRVLMQTYVAWQVPHDPRAINQFLRAVRNQQDDAGNQLRGFVSAALHITASNFNLADLINVDPTRVRIATFEQQLRQQISSRMLEGYGIEVRQVGIERLTLPAAALTATVSRMRAERATVAAARTAEGLRQAATIRADAARDGRETVAQAEEKSAETTANAQEAASTIYSKAFKADPQLYTTLRSIDTLGKLVGPNTTILLRTDSAPFAVLTNGSAGTHK